MGGVGHGYGLTAARPTTHNICHLSAIYRPMCVLIFGPIYVLRMMR